MFLKQKKTEKIKIKYGQDNNNEDEIYRFQNLENNFTVGLSNKY